MATSKVGDLTELPCTHQPSMTNTVCTRFSKNFQISKKALFVGDSTSQQYLKRIAPNRLRLSARHKFRTARIKSPTKVDGCSMPFPDTVARAYRAVSRGLDKYFGSDLA